MKYELKFTEIGTEVTLSESEYEVTITLVISPTDGVAPEFAKQIKVVSNNEQTGYEVDEQRAKDINSYISEINK